jgi:hypothetical protein
MKLLFAGGESKSVRMSLVEAGVQNVLVSYYYVKRRNVPIEFYFDHFPNLCLDSGGFTMIESFVKKSGHKDYKKFFVKHERYLDEYLEFCSNHAGRFMWVANYDIDAIVGANQVYEWNEKFKLLEKMGQTVCYIAHDYALPYTHLYTYFQEYDFVGVSTDHKMRKDNVGYFSQVYKLSEKYKKKTHGFAMTNFVSFQNYPFYTCDSTTYLGGAKFGSTYVYNGAYFETWDLYQKHRRKHLKHWCEKWDINFTDFVNDKSSAVTKFNIKAWLENEKLYNRRTKTRQWWNK